jgi:hypothetical protein
VTASLLRFHVRAAPAECTADVPPRTATSAAAHFSVQLRDSLLQPVVVGLANVAASVEPCVSESASPTMSAGAASAFAAADQPAIGKSTAVKLEQQGQAVFAGAFAWPCAASAVRLHITVDCKPVAGSPFTILPDAGVAKPSSAAPGGLRAVSIPGLLGVSSAPVQIRKRLVRGSIATLTFW